MIHKLASLLRDEISGLDFVEIAAGLAKPHIVRNPQDEEIIDRIVPMAYNDLGIDCEPGDLYPLFPNTKKRSIHWWEDLGTTPENEDTYYIYNESNLVLISWWNLPLINETYTDPSLLVANLISTIPESLPNNDYMTMMQVIFGGETPALADIVSKYTFDEAENQFNTFPYFITALNYQVNWAFAKNCPDSVVLSPSIC